MPWAKNSKTHKQTNKREEKKPLQKSNLRFCFLKILTPKVEEETHSVSTCFRYKPVFSVNQFLYQIVTKSKQIKCRNEVILLTRCPKNRLQRPIDGVSDDSPWHVCDYTDMGRFKDEINLLTGRRVRKAAQETSAKWLILLWALNKSARTCLAHIKTSPRPRGRVLAGLLWSGRFCFVMVKVHISAGKTNTERPPFRVIRSSNGEEFASLCVFYSLNLTAAQSTEPPGGFCHLYIHTHACFTACCQLFRHADLVHATCWCPSRASGWRRKTIKGLLNVARRLVTDGLLWVFQKLRIYWDFHAQRSRGFTENGPEKENYPASGSSLGQRALLRPEVGGKWPDGFQIAERQQELR